MAKKTVSRRNFLEAAALGGGSIVLGACAAPAAPEAPAAKEPVTIQANIAFTQADYGLQYRTVEKWRDLFQETHPGVTVNLAFVDWTEHHNKMLVLAAAGQLPDFVEVQASRSLLWAIEGVFLPIDEFVGADAKFGMSDFFEGVMGYYRWKDKIYALPYDHGPSILGYNKKMFDEQGVAYPDESWTFDTLLEKAVSFTKDGESWGFSGSPKGWLLEPSYLMPWGGKLFNDDETECLITMPESVAALQWWVDLRLKNKVAPTPAQSEVLATAGGNFVSGKVAMTTVAPWDAPTWNALADFEWDVAPWPKGPVARTTAGLGSGYGITKDTKHPEEAWAFLRWMTSSEGLAFVWSSTGASTPPRKSAFDIYFSAAGVAKHAQYFLDAMNDYMEVARPLSPNGPEFESIRNREMDLINEGLKSVEQGCADMKTDGDPILAKNSKNA